MALAPFFERIYSAVGGYLSVSRDNLATALKGITVGLKCSTSLSQNDFWIAELAINLFARLYPRIAIEASDSHVEKFRSIALSINPEIEILDEAPAKLTIGVGD